VTITNEHTDEHKKFALQEIFLFLPKENFPDSESYIFRKVIKFPKRWYKNFIFYSIFQKVISG